MNGSVLQLVLASALAAGAGATLAYFVATLLGKRRLRELNQQHLKVLGNVTAERDSFAQRAKEIHAKARALKSQNANYRSELKAMLSEKTTLADKNRRNVEKMGAEHRAAIDKITARNDDLAEQSTQMYEKIDELESDATDHRAELKAVKKERDVLSAENEALTENAKALADEVSNINSALSEKTTKMRAKIDQFKSEAKRYRTDLEAAQKERDVLTTENDALTKSVRTLTKQVEANDAVLSERSAEMQARIDELESFTQNYGTDLEGVQEERDALNAEIESLTENVGTLTDQIASKDTELSEQTAQMRAIIDELESAAKSYRSDLKAAEEERDRLFARNEALTENARTLADESKGLRDRLEALKGERELTKSKVNDMQNRLVAVHQRTMTLQGEFEKAGEFYKRELAKSFKRRQQLEQEIKSARAEEEAFRKRIGASVKKHGTTEEMLVNAEAQLGQINMLERSVRRLEAEKSELFDDLKQLRKDNERLQKENAEVVELRIHNEQLVRALETLERNRKEQESEADKARSKAKESEALSDTLRMRLGDLEKGFAEMEKDQKDAIKQVRNVASSTGPESRDAEYPEKYDLIPGYQEQQGL